ncbi:PREDICTED: protein PIH1D3 [Nanorana parkeri]|uniref:protein PIH1D3 n=1 Tax=Nanorana parkeri TaxID=125878 RepID=UPI000854B40B|nr:PREDICTED: protein PIH1D3 [Nanorana parkeri]
MDAYLGDFSNTWSMQGLCALLHDPSEEEAGPESHVTCPSSSAFVGPGDIGSVTNLQQSAATSQTGRDDKDIWSESEVQEGAEFDDYLDPREKPEYEILFKQRVSSEDMFLGLSRKDPSTACCEDMVIRVQLPDTNVADVSLDVKKNYINLRTPKYKLGLHLPHTVNDKSGQAKFMADTETLELILTMVRDLDFINFT